ncbi:MFS transporter [Micromonospora sp. NPDC050980]|uniref:MFS transporter n=1 Tax=Micromonospora sp. NPDC050980 TaxID=3155161 RepID=UPI0033F643BF
MTWEGWRRLRRPLRRPEFRVLWFGEVSAVLAGAAQLAVLSWLTLELTGSGLALGVTLLVGGLPRLVLILFGGALTDRFDPRGVMVASYGVRACATALLAVPVALGTVQLWHILLVRVMSGAVDALFLPAVSTMVPLSVEADEVTAANSAHRTVLSLGTIVGPAAAGLLIGGAGNLPPLLLCAALFAAATLLALRVRPRRAREVPPARTGLLRAVAVGSGYVWRTGEIRVLVVLLLVLNLALTGPLNVGVPGLAREVYDSPQMMGWLFAAFGVGTLIGSMAAGVLPAAPRPGVRLALLGGLNGAGVIGIGVAPSALTGLAFATAVGVTGGLAAVLTAAALQSAAAPEYLGRVMSWYALTGYGMAPLSALLTGFLLDLSAATAFVACGLLALTVAVASAATPALRGVRVREEAPTPTARRSIAP